MKVVKVQQTFDVTTVFFLRLFEVAGEDMWALDGRLKHGPLT